MWQAKDLNSGSLIPNHECMLLYRQTYYVYIKLNLVVLNFISNIMYSILVFFVFFFWCWKQIQTLCMLDKHFTIGTILHIGILKENTIKYILLPQYVIRTIIQHCTQ